MTTQSLRLEMAHPAAAARGGASHWHGVYRTGAVAALCLVLFTFFQIAVFILWPPPGFVPSATNVTGWYSLLQSSPLIGLLDLDLVMLVDYPAMLLVFLAVYLSLRRTNPSLTTVAAALGFAGIVSYFAVNPAFSMLALAEQHGAATAEAERMALVAAGQAIMAAFMGSGFNASYIMIGVGGLLMTIAMLQSSVFGRGTAIVGLVFYALGLVPASAGTLGLVFSLASLPPMIIWLVLVARRLWQLAREESV